MICTNCGVKNPEHAKFCYECGNALEIKNQNESSLLISPTETDTPNQNNANKNIPLSEPQKFTVILPVLEERSGGSRAAATLLLGFVGFAATSGKIRHKQMDAYVSTHKKGIKISIRKKYTKDVKIEWDKIVDVKLGGLYPKEIKMYLINEDYIKFRFGPVKELYPVIKENMCGVIPENVIDEGWD